jgi:CheY-like chemotaxis protein
VPEDVRRSVLAEMETSATRGADMVKQILAFARGTEGQRIDLQLRHVIAELNKILQRTLPKSITIHTAAAADLWQISGDATQLYQMLMNLCVNARDAMPQGGSCSISASNTVLGQDEVRQHPGAKPGPYVLVTVSDTGSGIPPEITDKIFDPFFTTKAFGKGTGLGLSTVLGIVKGHGGFITLSSVVGAGTQFSIYLPALAVAETQAAPAPPETLPYGHQETILVVDDEAAVRQVTRKNLEMHGYQVLTAQDGAEAVGIYSQHPGDIQLVLTDMMMPVMDGPATIRALKEMNPKVLIIAASGINAGVPIPEPSSGVQAFLPKPFTSEKLLKTVHEVLQRN